MNLDPKSGCGEIYLLPSKFRGPPFKDEMCTLQCPWPSVKRHLPINFMAKSEQKDVSVYLKNLDRVGGLPSFTNNVFNNKGYKVSYG